MALLLRAASRPSSLMAAASLETVLHLASCPGSDHAPGQDTAPLGNSGTFRGQVKRFSEVASASAEQAGLRPRCHPLPALAPPCLLEVKPDPRTPRAIAPRWRHHRGAELAVYQKSPIHSNSQQPSIRITAGWGLPRGTPIAGGSPAPAAAKARAGLAAQRLARPSRPRTEIASPGGRSCGGHVCGVRARRAAATGASICTQCLRPTENSNQPRV